MHRPLRALALGAVIVLAGCGGTSFDSVASSGSKTAPTTSNAPAVATSAERPYVDAMVASAAASDGSDDCTATIARCISTAIVRSYGVKVFVSSGITPNGLRNPNSTLDALPDPTDAQITSIGGELQRCRTGSLLAKSFAEGLKVTD